MCESAGIFHEVGNVSKPNMNWNLFLVILNVIGLDRKTEL